MRRATSQKAKYRGAERLGFQYPSTAVTGTIGGGRRAFPSVVEALASGVTMHLERRVLVSGGAGFLGSHLCERLLESGCQVLCVDNFFTGARHHIDHLLDHKRFELLRIDTVDGEPFLQDGFDAAVDVVACAGHREFRLCQGR